MALPSKTVDEASKCDRLVEEKSTDSIFSLIVRTKNKKFHLISYDPDHTCSLKEVTFEVKKQMIERKTEVIIMGDVQWSKQYGGTPVATGWSPEKVRDKMKELMAEFKDQRWGPELTKKAQTLTFAALQTPPKS